ncbi:MAG TPA: winged helix-turn-helix domain-containing protein [Cellulomonas sp.]
MSGSERPAPGDVGDDLDPGPVLRRGDLVVEVPSRCVRVQDRPVPLTRSEFEILVVLAERAGTPVSKDALARAIGPHAHGMPLDVPTTTADRRNIEVHMANLRRKLDAVGLAPRWIVTVRGVGYRLAREVRAGGADAARAT